MAEILTLHSDGPEDVEETWRRFVPSARLQRVDPRTFAFSWASATSGGVTAVTYELTASVASSIDPHDQLMACRVAAADGWVGTAAGDLDARLPWLAGERPTHARWSDRAQVRALVFDRAEAESVARTVSGDDRLVLRTVDPSPRSAALGRQWERAFHHVAATLHTGGEAGDPILEAEVRRYALVTTLAIFPTTFLEAVEMAAQRSAAPRTVRRAIAFIESHAREPLTVDDIARAAGISSRGLQYAFQRELGMTPTAYLRRVRLAGAHAELRTSAHPSVARIAREWGFGSSSRFARYYRSEYGRNPNQTARSF